jgi:hypothetical protein
MAELIRVALNSPCTWARCRVAEGHSICRCQGYARCDLCGPSGVGTPC